tara:strand:+ start:636 stop:872 length:237 start_codon:yes stop_codon:yes gene_type:complete
MFKEYESKPITRQAYQIKMSDHVIPIIKQFAKTGQYKLHGITFAASTEVNTNDWIVYISETDIYHCTDALFRERNVVP